MKKKVIIGLVVALVAIIAIASPVLAISDPDSTPAVEEIYCYRNIIETGDFLIIILENTPYATPPDTLYSSAFIWRLFDTDGTTEIDQALGFSSNDNGYNYNVIGWYFSASVAPTWGGNYYITLSGTIVAFDEPPIYNYQINPSDYSTLTDSSEVQAAISSRIIDLAEFLNEEWDLDKDDELTTSSELGVVLSVEGETFFRGAIYGIQRLAPRAFSYQMGDITSGDRTWDSEYSGNLSSQFADNYIGTGMEAGQEMLGADYNLFGLLGLLLGCGVLLGACVYVGGDIWGSLAICAGIAVIGARLTLVGLGEIALIVACAWIFITGKVWKVF